MSEDKIKAKRYPEYLERGARWESGEDETDTRQDFKEFLRILRRALLMIVRWIEKRLDMD